MFYEPGKGHGLPHDPFKAIVAPRPIGWISSLDSAGNLNLGPFSYFGAIATDPHLVWFSADGDKDSALHAATSGEFVANLVSRDLAEAMNRSSVDAPRGTSEFAYAGLDPAPSTVIATPRVAQAHAALECKVTQVLRPEGLGGRQSQARVVIGEVVGVFIDDAYLTDGLFDAVKAGTVSRLGYFDYASVTELFQMRRPRWKDVAKD